LAADAQHFRARETKLLHPRQQMNDTGVERVGWARPQWTLVTVSVLILQVAGLVVCSQRPALPVRTAPLTPVVRFLGPNIPNPHMTELLALHDPLVFREVYPNDSFDVRWLTHSRQMTPTQNWTEPSRLLAASDQYFADEFRSYVASTVFPSSLRTEKVPPRLAEIPLLGPTTPAQALFRIEGELAGRRMIFQPPLPTNSSSLLLTNTVLRVAVDGRGEMILATVLAPSGSAQADQSALDFAKFTRFESVKDSGSRSNEVERRALIFGHLVFQWFPVAPPATNQLTAKP